MKPKIKIITIFSTQTVVGSYLIAACTATAIALGLNAIIGWQLLFPSAAPSAQAAVRAEYRGEETQQFVRRLDGTIVTRQEEADAVPVGVMIENARVTRPQSGLSRARVVYETLVEGGITRLLALFLPSEQIEKIGPVRSVRHYYVDWIEEYGAPLAHAGGSPLGLGQIAAHRVPDLNGIGNAWRYFWRDRSVPAPHNLFTNSEQLAAAVHEFRYPTSAAFASWTYQGQFEGKPAASVAISFSSPAYAVRYEYDPGQQQYRRFNGGERHLDKSTGQQLVVDNVVVQFVLPPTSLKEKGRIDVETEGEGRVMVLRHGKVEEGTWQKSSSSERTVFLRTDGSPIPLQPGVTWVEVVPSDRLVVVE